MITITNDLHCRATLEVIHRLRMMVASWEPLPPGIDPAEAQTQRDNVNGIVAALTEDVQVYLTGRGITRLPPGVL